MLMMWAVFVGGVDGNVVGGVEGKVNGDVEDVAEGMGEDDVGAYGAANRGNSTRVQAMEIVHVNEDGREATVGTCETTGLT